MQDVVAPVAEEGSETIAEPGGAGRGGGGGGGSREDGQQHERRPDGAKSHGPTLRLRAIAFVPPYL